VRNVSLLPAFQKPTQMQTRAKLIASFLRSQRSAGWLAAIYT
jgi:hypothetical protein